MSNNDASKNLANFRIDSWHLAQLVWYLIFCSYRRAEETIVGEIKKQKFHSKIQIAAGINSCTATIMDESGKAKVEGGDDYKQDARQYFRMFFCY